MRTIRVELGQRSYPIHIEKGIISSIGPMLRDLGLRSRAAVVTNPRVGGLYARAVCGSLEAAGIAPAVITAPDGEEYKTLEEASKVYDALIGRRMERTSPVIALGGGVIGDLAGFVAATYLRGVPLIQMPTTLLAQVDSSVGGKTAVNHPKGKNLIGAFYQPRAVFIDPDVLKTLDEREMRAGLAEVIKYGVIWDERLFSFLENNAQKLLEPGDELITAIERSCRIKAEVVGADETESGLRSILNFGHTFGHAIEALSGYGTFKHGEAVAIGMHMAARFSAMLKLCTEETVERIRGLMLAVGLPVEGPDIPASAFIESMRLDKKVEGNRIRLVLIKGIGLRPILKEAEEAELEGFFTAPAR